MDINKIAKIVKTASIHLGSIDTKIKNDALKNISIALKNKIFEIEAANQRDISEAEKNQLAAPIIKRLKFDKSKIETTIEGINSLIQLEDPIGITLNSMELDKNLDLYRVSCPIGVIGVIFESRPDALVQISSLCLKSGNALLLKGGSEAKHTNKILFDIIKNATIESGIPNNWIFLIETRQEVFDMLKADKYIDLIIPRGSNEFVKFIIDNSNIPVLGHADGICHVFIDEFADINMAINVTTDSKCQYVSVCNAAETILVHSNIASSFLPELKKSLDKYNVEIFGCKKTQAYIPVSPAAESDWKTEYLDYKVSIKVVKNLTEAIDHINEYGSGHTDSIITTNKENAIKFMNLVDSGNVFWNCSTRFSDGYRYGLGAEVGISTNKIHARGPVGLEGLTIYKWKLIGDGNIVSDYALGKKKFVHKKSDKKFSIS